MKEIAIVVVTYNRFQLLKECIENIRKQTYQNFDIIVVNNGSTDETPIWLKEQNDIITLTQQNLGGAGGFYTGIKYASHNKYKFTWLMDDDTIPTATALEHLVNASQKKNTFGFLCSRVIDINGSTCNYPSIDYLKASNGEYIWLSDITNNLIRVKNCTFVSVLINNNYLKEIGYPFKEFFIWGDDIEYTTRFSKKYDCYLAFDSLVIHKRVLTQVISIFTEKNKSRVKNHFYAYRNKIYSSWKNNKAKGIAWYFISLHEAFKLLFKGNFYKSFIVLKALVSVLFFSPKIEFPNDSNV